jgi:hypothetical protein
MEEKMPRGDGTGPNSQGPMTGRGMGYCAGFDTPGYTNVGVGRGMGRGLARGRGFAWRARVIQAQQPAVITEKQEKQYLEQELNLLKQEIKDVENRLKEIKETKE